MKAGLFVLLWAVVRARVWIGLSVAALALAGACSSRDRAKPLRPFQAAGGSGGGLILGEGGQPCVGRSLCGHEIHEVTLRVPNVYFIFDRSGSMQELVAPSFAHSRYSVVRDAAIEMVQTLGPLINLGAAAFPGGGSESEGCEAGGEILKVSAGDSIVGGVASGPTTNNFITATDLRPRGGTPVAATLRALAPRLGALPGETRVILLTDGAPNCNEELLCGVATCGPNIEGTCSPDENCCAPSHPTGGPRLCIDRSATVAAVKELAERGVEVFVVGIPGSEDFDEVLNEMALAGGSALWGRPVRYHRVDDLAAIGAVFSRIAADAISCEIAIAKPPTDRLLSNVYLDCEVLPLDPVDGWSWTEEGAVVLNGEACQRLKSGEVSEVHVVSGCPTETPR